MRESSTNQQHIKHPQMGNRRFRPTFQWDNLFHRKRFNTYLVGKR